MNPPGQAEMPFTELDLHHLTVRANWVVGRASLSETQLEALVALIKHPMSPEMRETFKFWLNEIVAQYVENLAKRSTTLDKLDQLNLQRRWSYRSPFERGPKLSTLVRDELNGLQAAFQKVTNATLSVSPEARAALRESFRRNQLAMYSRPQQGRNFRLTWQAADDAFLYFQVACERREGQRGCVSDRVDRELDTLIQAFDLLRSAIEDLTQITRDLLEETFDRPAATAATSIRPDHTIEDPAGCVLAWLKILGNTLERPQIEIKRGRDEAPERALVRALAELYRVTTRHEPRRTHRAFERFQSDVLGETGDFLELVRKFVGYANASLPGGIVCGTRALSKIVRQELTNLKCASPG